MMDFYDGFFIHALMRTLAGARISFNFTQGYSDVHQDTRAN
jgi:hypothetical protein